MRRVLDSSMLVATALLAVGCATHHTVEPYRSDPDAARRLEARAERICAAMVSEERVPERPFVTDGCSGFPDGERVHCCVEHDIPYWCGGSREQRREADALLGHCVAQTGRPALGRVMNWGVRVTAHPIAPAGWRWGFGHPYPACYEEPATEEVPEPWADRR